MTVDSKTGSKSVSRNRKPQDKAKFKKSPHDKSKSEDGKRTNRFSDTSTTKKSSSSFKDHSRSSRDERKSESSSSRDQYRSERRTRFDGEDRKNRDRDRPNRFESRDQFRENDRFKDRDYPKKRSDSDSDNRGDHRFGNDLAKDRRQTRFQKPFDKRNRTESRSFEKRTQESSRGGLSQGPRDGSKNRSFVSDRGESRRPDRYSDRNSDRGIDRNSERNSERNFERRPDSRQDRRPSDRDGMRRPRETFTEGKTWNSRPREASFKRESKPENNFGRGHSDRTGSATFKGRDFKSGDFKSGDFKSTGPKVSPRRQEISRQESPRPFHEKPRRIGPISRTEQDPRTRPIGKRILEVQTDGPCQIKNECRSCLYVNLPYEPSLKLKHGDGIRKLDVFVGKAIVHEPIPSPKPLYYRTHVKLAVRRNPNGGADIGLFEPGSHKVVNLDQCPVQSGVINHFIRKFRTMVDEMGLEAYDESTGEGWLRYIAIRVAHLTGELMVSLVVTRHDEALGKKIHGFLRKNEEKFSSLHFNIQPEPGNAIWGEETIHIGGEKTLSESLCGLKFEISPQSFFQINPPQAQNLYRTVERYAANPTGQPVAWDLYSGCGQITMLLARAGYRAVGIEEIPAAVENAKSNVLRNKLSAEFILGRVEDKQFKLPSWAQKPSLIVANPSRRGMAETTRKVLAGVAMECRSTLIYVSCDVDTLARDLKDLTDGGLKVRQVHSFDMFAQTAGLEWLVVLTP